MGQYSLSSHFHCVGFKMGTPWQRTPRERPSLHNRCQPPKFPRHFRFVSWSIRSIPMHYKIHSTPSLHRNVRHLAGHEQMHSCRQTRTILRMAIRIGGLAVRFDFHRSHAIGQGTQLTVRCHWVDKEEENQIVDLPGGNASQYRRNTFV